MSMYRCSVIWVVLMGVGIQGADVVPGSVTLGLQKVFNAYSSGVPGVTSPPIDMDQPGDGRLYVASLGGQVIVSENGNQHLFLDVVSNPYVPFTTNFAGGLLGIAFHPDYLIPGTEGFHKFYTFSTDWKTINQSRGGSIGPGSELTGLPDFWHPEMYAPATTGNPLTDWTNPNSPSPGNTDFDHFNVVREWTADANGLVIDTNIPPRVILRIAHGFAGKGSHNGGAIRFGPDGHLYISLGAGGGNAGKDYDGNVNNGEDGHTNGTGNGQDLTVIYGKVLRIDPTAEIKNSANGQYGIPSSNPYVADDSYPEVLDEIYAYGFRNPWKMNFDDRVGGNGALYLSDVGQHHREEIDVITAGGNYGWGYLEGNVRLVHEDSQSGESDPTDLQDGTHGTPVRTPPEGFENFISTAPLVDYLTRRQTVPGIGLVGDGTAVTGGFVYRGFAIPALRGMYVFGDYSIGSQPPQGLDENQGRLFYIEPNEPNQIFEFQVNYGASYIGQLLGFGDNDAGELYTLFDNGHVLRMVGSYTWNVDANGTWDTPANWTGSVPDGNDIFAVLGRVITTNRQITVDSPVTLSGMTVDSPFGYVLSGEGIITLETTEGESEINTVSGRHVISTKLSCLNDLVMNVVSPSAQLSLFNLLAASNRTLSKRGEGALTLTSTSSVLSHNVTVATGLLQVDGTLATEGISIDPKATLSGNGVIDTQTPLSVAGILAPGTGVGTLTVEGDVALKTGGYLQIEISENSTDRIILHDLDLSSDNLSLDIVLIGNSTPGDYLIAEYAGTLTGTFEHVTEDVTVDYGVPGQVWVRLY